MEAVIADIISAFQTHKNQWIVGWVIGVTVGCDEVDVFVTDAAAIAVAMSIQQWVQILVEVILIEDVQQIQQCELFQFVLIQTVFVGIGIEILPEI